MLAEQEYAKDVQAAKHKQNIKSWEKKNPNAIDESTENPEFVVELQSDMYPFQDIMEFYEDFDRHSSDREYRLSTLVHHTVMLLEWMQHQYHGITFYF